MRWSVPIVVMFVTLCAGCGTPTPDEYLAKAEAAEKAKDFPLALREYSDLVKDHPQSPQAEVALFKIADIQHGALKDVGKAIDAYKHYLQLFPEGGKAPGAMFTIAFMYNNELHNLDSAGAVYKRFLEKYPHHELASAAVYELQNLGKSPDELIPHDDKEKTPPSGPPGGKQTKDKKNV